MNVRNTRAGIVSDWVVGRLLVGTFLEGRERTGWLCGGGSQEVSRLTDSYLPSDNMGSEACCTSPTVPSHDDKL